MNHTSQTGAENSPLPLKERCRYAIRSIIRNTVKFEDPLTKDKEKNSMASRPKKNKRHSNKIYLNKIDSANQNLIGSEWFSMVNRNGMLSIASMPESLVRVAYAHYLNANTGGVFRDEFGLHHIDEDQIVRNFVFHSSDSSSSSSDEENSVHVPKMRSVVCQTDDDPMDLLLYTKGSAAENNHERHRTLEEPSVRCVLRSLSLSGPGTCGEPNISNGEQNIIDKEPHIPAKCFTRSGTPPVLQTDGDPCITDGEPGFTSRCFTKNVATSVPETGGESIVTGDKPSIAARCLIGTEVPSGPLTGEGPISVSCLGSSTFKHNVGNDDFKNYSIKIPFATDMLAYYSYHMRRKIRMLPLPLGMKSYLNNSKPI